MEKVETAVLVPKWEIPSEPSWDRARVLLEEVKQTVRAIVLLGVEIQGLRAQFFNQGGSTRIGTHTERTNGGRALSVTGTGGPAGTGEKGWERVVEDELGISARAARRLMEKAQYVCMLEEVTRGEHLRYKNTKGEVKELTPSSEMQQMAFGFLSDVVAGTVNAKRAWAGLMGEGTRRGSGGGPNRSAVNHHRNLCDALKKLRTSLKSWNQLNPDDRAKIETLWFEVSKLIPPTWIA